jgi:hypothetical protein
VARINFEDRVFKEQGFQDLMIAVQSRLLAKGIVLELWTLAQEYWFPDRKPIPMDRFKAAGLPEILFAPAGLAEIRDGGVYAKGSEEQFRWLFDAQKAGEASAEARRKKKESKPKRTKLNGGQPPLNGSQEALNGSQPVSTSLLSTPYSSLSSLTPDSSSLLPSDTRDDSRAVAKAPTKAQMLIGKYIDAWKAKHGSKPDIMQKDAGIAKRLASALTAERAALLIDAYFEMPESYFIKAKHPLELFESRLKEIAVFADSGSFVTRRQASMFDDAASNMLLLEKVKRGAV